MISASLFGALAGSGALPFPREAYEETIKGSGRGVKPSLAAFAAAYQRALQAAVRAGPSTGGAGRTSGPGPRAQRRCVRCPRTEAAAPSMPAAARSTGPSRLLESWQALDRRASPRCRTRCATWRCAGCARSSTIRTSPMAASISTCSTAPLALDERRTGHALSHRRGQASRQCPLLRRHDPRRRPQDALDARCARAPRGGRRGRRPCCRSRSISIRASRNSAARCRPRLGRYIEARPKLAAFIDRRINKGRRIRTDSMTGFAMLWVIGGLRRFRRKLLRHQVEAAHLERLVRAGARPCCRPTTTLAVEILNCRRLIKGYSDTHVRERSRSSTACCRRCRC